MYVMLNRQRERVTLLPFMQREAVWRSGDTPRLELNERVARPEGLQGRATSTDSAGRKGVVKRQRVLHALVIPHENASPNPADADMSSVQQSPEAASGETGVLSQLAKLLPVLDLTAVRLDELQPLRRDPLQDCTLVRESGSSDLLTRAMHRGQRRHVLLTGRKGVGKTARIHELAQLIAVGDVPFLANHRILWIDGQNVGPEDSRACLESIFTAVAPIPRLILCLDGLGALLKRTNGGTNKPLLRAMISRSDVRLIGILSSWEYNDLIGGDAEMHDLFTRIEIEEPSEEIALTIARQHALGLQTEFSIRIEGHVVERTVALASTFILNECHPAKSIRILRQVCEDAAYDRTQLGSERDDITVDDVVRAIAEKTGIPPHTIAGESDDVDFDRALEDAVVGQDEAVRQVAGELRLIKSGLTEPGKPAAVMLFAGMTGVGKTELAKRIAELYSTSRRLQIYSMGNFTEPHSVSGIIGVPPGYVGHEQGGRLINELNSDPYSVFLLDEAEKCHPNIWKPFLNLFDEGWIVDQRGVKAYADRAIFILTTNAGDRNVSQMTENGASQEEIAEQVKQGLSRVRHERSSQPVFPPQFLSRIKRIIVFNPLSEAAMIGVAERVCRRMQDLWLRKREKRIEISRELIECIGHEAHRRNASARGEEGGRIVRKLVSDLIESRIQDTAMTDRDAYRRTEIVRVGIECSSASDPRTQPLTVGHVEVSFSRELATSPEFAAE